MGGLVVCFAAYLDSGQFTLLPPEQTRFPQVFVLHFGPLTHSSF